FLDILTCPAPSPCLPATSLSRPHHRSALFPYTTLFRPCRIGSSERGAHAHPGWGEASCRIGSSEMPGLDWMVKAGASCRIGSSRSEEHTSELQSRENLVCRLLLEKKKSP